MKKSSFEVFRYFIQNYPFRSCIVLFALLLAGAIETVGIGALLPLLNVMIAPQDNLDSGVLTHIVDSIFVFLGIEQNLKNLLVVIVLTISLKSFIIYHAMKIVAYSATDITKDLRTNLIQSLMNTRWQYYSALPMGQSATAIATEAEQSGQFFMLTGKAVAAFIQAFIYALIVLIIDWKVSAVAILFGLIGAYCFKSLVRIARQSGVQMADVLQNLIIRLNESLMGVKPLKAMGEENRFINLLKKDINIVNQAKKRQLSSNLLLQAFQEPLLVTLISMGLYIAYNHANYSITELLLIAFLFHRLISQINVVQTNYQKSINFEGAVRSILKSLDKAKEFFETSTGNLEPTLLNEISFQNIDFYYEDKAVLTGFTDSIPVQKFTVVFGPSGVGKSTLLDMVLGLLAPSKGDVLLDNTFLNKVDIRKWRHKIGYVPQETFLFHDTIFQNITLGNDNISKDQVIEALKISNAWEFIEVCDGKLQHIVGERGGRLSGGQKQRLALARAIVRNPQVLILDEATTGLDKKSEAMILDSLKSMLKDTTIIAISHDPKILDIADHVIRLDKKG